MKDCCSTSASINLDSAAAWTKKARKVLWFALIVNLGMFFIEMAYSFKAESLSLRADAVDFLSDSASYVITLFVLESSLKIRNRAAVIKALGMGVLGLWVLVSAILQIFSKEIPHAPTMGMIGAGALLANLIVAWVLFQFRKIDANMESVWLCSRNDAINNLAVLFAALGVWKSTTHWPDLIVGVIISILSISATVQIFQRLKKGEDAHLHEGHQH